jgi:hypothetical protein
MLRHAANCHSLVAGGGVAPVAALATAAFVQMIARLDKPLISS